MYHLFKGHQIYQIMIRSIRITKVEGSNEGVPKGVNINIDVKIKKDEKGKEIITGNDITFTFTWTATYSDTGAPYIRMNGEVIASYENADEIVKNWAKKEPNYDVVNEIIQAVNQVCSVGAVFVSDVLRMPPPLPSLIPPITKKTAKTKKEG